MKIKGKIKDIFNRVRKDFVEYRVAIALFLIYYFVIKAIFHAYCPMILITGLPCPACGMTRAIFLFLTGEFTRYWNLQPQAVLWIAFTGWFLYRRYIVGKKVTGFQTTLILLLILLIIAYIYRMITEFPSYPPMTYRRNNLFANIFYFYEDLLRILFNL